MAQAPPHWLSSPSTAVMAVMAPCFEALKPCVTPFNRRACATSALRCSLVSQRLSQRIQSRYSTLRAQPKRRWSARSARQCKLASKSGHVRAPAGADGKRIRSGWNSAMLFKAMGPVMHRALLCKSESNFIEAWLTCNIWGSLIHSSAIEAVNVRMAASRSYSRKDARCAGMTKDSGV